MKFTKSILTGTGALLAGGLILALLAPKAAHAIAATAVQVMNTAAAPAVSQDVSKLASANIMLYSQFVGDLSDTLHIQGKDGGRSSTPFTVPAGQTLIITSIDFFPDGGFNLTPEVFLQNSATTSSSLYGVWSVPPANSFQYTYPTGIAIEAGVTPVVTIPQSGFQGLLLIHMNGYLTAN